VCSVVARSKLSFMDVTAASNICQQIVAESGGSFRDLEPAIQAMLQTIASRLVMSPCVLANSAPVLGLLPVVPLLASRAYWRLLDDLILRKQRVAACLTPHRRAQYSKHMLGKHFNTCLSMRSSRAV
jgi:hypothetical protein